MVELRDRALGLATMPRRGPVVAQLRGSAVHKLIHGNYLIFYRVVADRVEILAVRHGAQRGPTFD